jgi:hypothetical protein
MNESMHKVNDVYRDLAGIVDEQQEKIDTLEGEVDYAAGNVDAAVENISCYHQIHMNNFLACGSALPPFGGISGGGGCANGPVRSFDTTITFSDKQHQTQQQYHEQQRIPLRKSSSICDSQEEDEHQYIRVAESFNWLVPFETFEEDMSSVQNDIMVVGKGVMSQSKRFHCGSLP